MPSQVEQSIQHDMQGEVSGSSERAVPIEVSTILGRRAIRSGYTASAIPVDILQQIVDCGLNAPSSKNAQPWKLHIVHERLTLRRVARYILNAKSARRFVPQDPTTGLPRADLHDTVDESAHTLGQVPLGIFIEDVGNFSVNRRAVSNAESESREDAIFGYGLEYIGLGACIQNMWLAAEANGLSGVFMGDAAIAESEIKNLLNMDGDFVGVLALGYSDDQPTPKALKTNGVIWHTHES